MDYVANGNPTQAEYAATALANMKNASTVLTELARDLVDELFVSDANLLTNLTSLAQFALYAPDLISPSIDTIIRFIESDLLPAKTTQVRNIIQVLVAIGIYMYIDLSFHTFSSEKQIMIGSCTKIYLCNLNKN